MSTKTVKESKTRKKKSLAEGKVSKGGQDIPGSADPIPPAPEGSNGDTSLVFVPEESQVTPEIEIPDVQDTIAAADQALKEPIDVSKIDPKLKANVDGHNAARDVLELIRDELKDQANPRFWEIVRDAALKEVGLPMQPISGAKPLDDKRAKRFLKSQMPRGQFAGKTVEFVLKRDPEYLKEFARSPDSFQKRLERFLVRRE